jgi:tripartite-type tricarboxylate transporter receptor subunit TctC
MGPAMQSVYNCFSQLLAGTAFVLPLLGFNQSSPALANSQTYPQKYVRIIVPFPPGGPNDFLARTIGRRLSEVWGQAVIIENKPGAATQIGAEYVAKAAPDGYTLMVTSNATSVLNPLLYKKLLYDPLRDFVPVSGIVSNYQALAANPTLPANTVAELIALAKSKPGELNYGTFGLVRAVIWIWKCFQKMAGINLAVIHYSGTGPALTDLIGGHIQLMFTNTSTVAPFAKAGKVKLLGVGSPKRLPQLPDVVTISENGLPGFDTQGWFGIFAPSGTPPEIVMKINNDVQRVINEPAFRTNVLEPGMFEPMLYSPEQFAKFIKSDAKKWQATIGGANLHLD